MADPLSVAASVIGIAAFGIKIVTTINTFTHVYRGAESRITTLAADVALTSSILKSIGETIDAHHQTSHLAVGNFIAVRDTCQRDFDALSKALRIVKKDAAGIENGSSVGKPAGKENVDVWVKLKHALGGEEVLRELVASIETSKSNLQLLLSSLNLAILTSLKKR